MPDDPTEFDTQIPNPPNNPLGVDPERPPALNVTVETILAAILKQRWSIHISYRIVPPDDGYGEEPQYTVRALGPEGLNRVFPMHNTEVVSVSYDLKGAIAALPQKIAEERKRLQQ